LGLIINRKRKFAYIHIPKTGGTSLSSILLKVDGSEILAIHDSIRLLNDVDDYFIFTIVRNPFTRLASAYYDRIKDNSIKLNEFIDKINYKDSWYFPQLYFINSGKRDNVKISYIGKYESYTESVKVILNTLDLKYPIPHLNRNPIYDRHPNIKQHEFYKYLYEDEWCKDWVRERYIDDFKQFNYELDI